MKIIYRKYQLFLTILFVCLTTGCKEDDSTTCLNCSSEATPKFELCRQSNDNASVNGEDTGTPYEQYLEDLQDTGVRCGG